MPPDHGDTSDKEPEVHWAASSSALLWLKPVVSLGPLKEIWHDLEHGDISIADYLAERRMGQVMVVKAISCLKNLPTSYRCTPQQDSQDYHIYHV